MDLDSLTIDSARTAIAERKTTATALAEAFYDKIQKDDPQIGAYLILSKDRAMETAGRIDRLAAQSKDLPPLGGVPVGIKDVMVTRGVRSTAGSKILGNYIPPYDCTAVARMAACPAVPQADQQQRWRRAWPSSRWAPIPVVPFASRHRFAEW